MYCPKCGKEIARTSRFCDICGTSHLNLLEDATDIACEKEKKRGKKKILLVVVGVAEALLFYYVMTMPRVNLKYKWGTDYSVIDDNETAVARIDPGDKVYGQTFFHSEYTLRCADDAGNVDGLEGVSNDSRVEYTFDPFEMKLVAIQYEHGMPDDVDERIEIMEDIYGSDYYISDDDNPRETANIYWWIGDTVICVSSSHVWYMYEEHFLKYRTQWTIHQELVDHFDKK